MHILEGSLLYRGLKYPLSWLARAGRDSLVGRSLRSLSGFVSRAVSASFILGTSGFSTIPLESADQPASVLVISRPYLWLRRHLAEGFGGRTFDRLGVWAGDSALGGGEWSRLAGATLIGMAIARATQSSLLVSLSLVIVGVVFAAWGPRIFSSTKTSPATRSRWVVVSGLLVCLASGVIAGLAGSWGPAWMSGGVLVLVAVVVLLWRPEALLLLVAAFPWLDALARELFGASGGLWDEFLVLLSAALLFWGAVVTGRLRMRTVPVLLPALFYVVAGVGSIVVRGVPSDVGLFGLRVFLEPLFFYFIGFLFFTDLTWTRRIVAVFLASTTGLALHGFYQYVTGVPTPPQWLDSTETEITTRAFSVLGKPNELGSALIIGIMVTLALLLSARVSKRMRVVLFVALVAQMAGVAVTFSRGAWIGLACGLVALMVLAYRRYLLPAVLVVAAVIPLLPKVFMDRFALVFSDTYLSKAAVDGRTWRWTAALDQFAAHPWFGAGLGTFGGTAADKFGYWDIWVDNYYLQTAAEGGLLLLAALLWLMLRVAKGLVKGAKSAADPFARSLAAGAFGAFIGVAVANAFAGVLETRPVAIGLWLIAGLATAASLVRVNQPTR